VAERLGIEERILLEKVRNTASNAPGRNAPIAGTAARQASSDGNLSSVGRTASAASRRRRFERQIIAILLHVPELFVEVEQLNALGYFENVELKRLGETIVSVRHRLAERRPAADPAGPEFLPALMDVLEMETDRELIDRLLAELAVRDEQWTLEGCRTALNHFVDTARRQHNCVAMEQRIKEAERNNDQEALEKLLAEKQNAAVLREKRKMAMFDKA
jgi:hypothetical protein